MAAVQINSNCSKTIVLINLLFFIHTASQVKGDNEKVFFLESNALLTIAPIKAPIAATSRVQCAKECLQLADRCQSFLFQKENGKCVLGSWAISSTVPRDPNDSVLYTSGSSFSCPSNPGFTLETNGSVSSCLWASEDSLNYTEAQSACEEKGAHLYTVKVVEKLNILLRVVDSLQIWEAWIGLNDIQQEGVYRWIDDGSILNVSFTFWDYENPSDYNGGEDCTGYSIDYFPFNDISCSTLFPFVCEISPN